MMMMIATAAEAGRSGGNLSWVEHILEWGGANSVWGLLLLGLGLLGQTVFFGRWIVQMIATERRKESHVPEMFWWMSLVGASMLFTYFVLRQDLIGMLGQCIGWTVYMRNLYHIHRKKKQGAVPPAPDAVEE